MLNDEFGLTGYNNAKSIQIQLKDWGWNKEPYPRKRTMGYDPLIILGRLFTNNTFPSI